MWGKRIIWVALVGAVLAVITGGVVAAQSVEESPRTFTGKVAMLLGIDEDTVRDATRQAKREIQDEKLQRRLSNAVERGKLTQDQADRLSDWYQSRPDDITVEPFLGKHRPGKRGKR